jgi:hypothetical protein
MSVRPTLLAITNLLENGTGDPGLSFDVPDGATIERILSDDLSEVWIVYPGQVIGEDGPHDRCVLIITVICDDTGRPMFRVLAVDAEGEPCAYHEC